MSPGVLIGAYVAIGLACATLELVTWRRRRTRKSKLDLLVSVVTTLVLWPLWAPFSLGPGSRRGSRSGRSSRGTFRAP